MRKGTDILGRDIIAYSTGERIARVQDLIFDQNDNQLLGFLVDEAGLFRSARVVSLSVVKAIGMDAIVVPDESSIVSAKSDPRIENVLNHSLILKGNRIVTADGRYLGSVVDLFFDEQTGTVEGYETSGGLFADAYSGRSFIPAPNTIKIGREFTFVPPETADLMEEQVGGIRGAMQSAGARIQEAAEVGNQQFQEAASGANDRFDQGSRSAIAGITSRLVSPEEQLIYVVGKTVDRDILTQDNRILVAQDQVVTPTLAQDAQQLGILDQVYRATGGSLTVGINRRLQETTNQVEPHLQTVVRNGNAAFSNVMSRMSVEQARGHRAQFTVRGEGGFIVAAPGQIVTDAVVQRAKDYHREAALLDAVGLQPSEAARHSAKGTLSETRSRLREGAVIAQENANSFWHNLKIECRDLQKHSQRAIHKRRIEHALGRPVTRVILDAQDIVILNTGELITHQAVRQAEQSDVLNILLNSVYAKEPKLSEAEFRAAETGTASLEREHGLATQQQ